MQFLLDQLQLLVQIRRCNPITLRQLGLIQYFIDRFSKLIQLVPVLLILQFEGNDHLLVIFLTLPLLTHQLSCRIYFLR